MAGQKLCFLIAISAAVILGVCGEFQFKHHDNQELATILEDVHLRCPNITRVYTLSENSVNGNPLLLIEFTDKPGRHELRKILLFFQLFVKILKRFFFFINLNFSGARV